MARVVARGTGGTPMEGTLAAAIASGGGAAGDVPALTAPPPAPACTCPGGGSRCRSGPGSAAAQPATAGNGACVARCPATERSSPRRPAPFAAGSGPPRPLPVAPGVVADAAAGAGGAGRRRRRRQARRRSAVIRSAAPARHQRPAGSPFPRRTVQAKPRATKGPSTAPRLPDAGHSPGRRSARWRYAPAPPCRAEADFPAPSPGWDRADSCPAPLRAAVKWRRLPARGTSSPD